MVDEPPPRRHSKPIRWVGRGLAIAIAVGCVLVLDSWFFAAVSVLLWISLDGAIPLFARLGTLAWTGLLVFYVLGASTMFNYGLVHGTKYQARTIDPIAGLEIECRVSVSSDDTQLTPGLEVSRWRSPNGINILVYDPEFRFTRAKITDAQIHDTVEASLMLVEFDQETRMFDQPEDPVDGWIDFQHGWHNAGGGITKMKIARCGLSARGADLDSFVGDELWLSFRLWLVEDGVVTVHDIKIVLDRRSALGTRLQLNLPT